MFILSVLSNYLLENDLLVISWGNITRALSYVYCVGDMLRSEKIKDDTFFMELKTTPHTSNGAISVDVYYVIYLNDHSRVYSLDDA